jgi:ubiquinone/menaquinone biosynthesis C-methylase UbiE
MEINLLDSLPKVNRDVNARSAERNPDLIRRAKKYDWEYFDRKVPKILYGGYVYDGRWQPVARRFAEYYHLGNGAKILDIGCAKGYLLYDFLGVNNTFKVLGLDISSYALNCCPTEVTTVLGNAKDLSMFADKGFDLVISINTIHNLPEKECRQAVREIQRVGKNGFISVDAYRNDEEERRMMSWNCTAETIHSVNDWINLYDEEHYTGDYYWFIP